MTPLKVCRFWQARRPFTVGLLLWFSILGLALVVEGQTDHVTQLITQLKDQNSEVREKAALALDGIKDPRAVEPLIAALKDADYQVRGFAAQALGDTQNSDAVEPLIAALKDTDWSVRRFAAEALGKAKDLRATQPLRDALSDPDSTVRQRATESLGKINAPREASAMIVTQSDGASGPRQTVPDDRVGKLIGQLQGTDSALRMAAAFQLGQLKDPRAIDPLRAALTDSDSRVQQEATEALAKINSSRAVGLAGASEDDQIKTKQPSAQPSTVLSGSHSRGECRVMYHYSSSDLPRHDLIMTMPGPWGTVIVKAIGRDEWAGESPWGLGPGKLHVKLDGLPAVLSAEFTYSFCQRVTSTADGTTFILVGVARLAGLWSVPLAQGQQFPVETKGHDMFITGFNPKSNEIIPPASQIGSAKMGHHKYTYKFLIIAECKVGDPCPSADQKQDFPDLP